MRSRVCHYLGIDELEKVDEVVNGDAVMMKDTEEAFLRTISMVRLAGRTKAAEVMAQAGFRSMNARRLLISSALVAFSLSAPGCEQSESSSNQISSTETTTRGNRADSEHEAEPNAEPAEVNDAGDGRLAVGDKAPDFEVEVMGGGSLRLSSCFGAANRPTVLLFDRAHW